MSTIKDYIVDLEASLAEAASLADRVVEELVRRGIVLDAPQTHPLCGQGSRYSVGPRMSTVAHHNDIFPSGLDVEVGRAVFTPGENGVETLQCPTCSHMHPEEDLAWADAVTAWYEQSDADAITCPQCGTARPVTEWLFEPAWGFGNLAFVFTECLLTEAFVQEVGQLLGHRVAWVKSYW